MSVINQITVGNTTYDVQDLISRPILTQAEYNALEQAGLVDPDKDYHISNGMLAPTPVDDNDVSTEKTWSSKKISDSLPKTFSFDVTNVACSTAYGQGYVSAIQEYDLGIDASDKMIFTSFNPSGNYTAWIIVLSFASDSNSVLRIQYVRNNSQSITGKLCVMVTD